MLEMIKKIDNEGYFYGMLNKSIDEFVKIISEYKERSFSKNEIELGLSKTSAKKTLTKIFNNKEFPYHTDGVQYELPPKYIILLRTREASQYTATNIIDGLSIAENNKELFFQTSFIIKGNGFRELSNIVKKKGEEYLLRYNPVIMSSYTSDKRQEIDAIFKEVPPIKIDWKSNDILIIDNWRMLHSRDEIKNTDGIRGLKRIELYYE